MKKISNSQIEITSTIANCTTFFAATKETSKYVTVTRTERNLYHQQNVTLVLKDTSVKGVLSQVDSVMSL